MIKSSFSCFPVVCSSGCVCVVFLLCSPSFSHVMEQAFRNAGIFGRADDVQALLRDHPDLNVNERDEDDLSALHWASYYGHAGVVKLLLAHPAIDVNLQNRYGFTPFSLGCSEGQVSVVQLLLKDPRVDVTLAENDDRTPLWRATYFGHQEVVEWLIACGRDLGDLNKRGKWGYLGENSSALEIAQLRNKTEVISLLRRFMANPAQTRLEVRLRLGVLEPAARLFALTVFLCDDLLQPQTAAATLKPAIDTLRFFAIAKGLPMELQMILCHRVFGSMKQNILRQESEAAFRSLAKVLLVLPSQSH